jgi:hypothetical protein
VHTVDAMAGSSGEIENSNWMGTLHSSFTVFVYLDNQQYQLRNLVTSIWKAYITTFS